MKNIYTYFTLSFIFFASLTFKGCTDGFAEMNTHPGNVATLTPDQLLVRAQSEWIRAGRTWDISDSQLPWMQYTSAGWGTGSAAVMVNKWGWRGGVTNPMFNEFNNMGAYVTYIEFLAENAPDNRFSNIATMARITLIAKAIHTSDMQGSLVYSQGWRARIGMMDYDSMNPRFDTQEELVVIWDRELREAIQTLQNNMNDPNQVNPRGMDRAYVGDTQRWIRAANGIRLRLASRLWNVQPATARAIATEVLAPANAMNIFASNDDSFIFWHDRNFIFGGEWHSVHDMNHASRNFMNYLQRNQDPRKRIFFRPNRLTREMIISHNLAAMATNPFNMIPLTTTRWEGAHVCPTRRGWLPPPAVLADVTLRPNRADFPAGDAGQDAFVEAAIYFMENFDWREDNVPVSPEHPGGRWDRNHWQGGVAMMRPASPPQARTWAAGHVTIEGVPGNGGIWMPVMTFADFSFLAAEFVLRENIPSSRTAQQWYETGVRASLDQWNFVARFADAIGFEEMTEEEINTFLSMPDIAWNPTKALEQIYTQAFVEHFRNVTEMHALWKRTNFPNTQSTIIPKEEIIVEGVTLVVPRRARFSRPNPGSPNFNNWMRALDQMEAEPNFGPIENEWGRVWWDAPAP